MSKDRWITPSQSPLRLVLILASSIFIAESGLMIFFAILTPLPPWAGALVDSVSLVAAAQVRGGDIACRYGGEEFTLILPETPLDVMVRRVDALRLNMKQLIVRHRGQPLGAVTLSAGVAVFPEHGVAGDTLLHAADRALHRARVEGRDRVVMAGVAEGWS